MNITEFLFLPENNPKLKEIFQYWENRLLPNLASVNDIETRASQFLAEISSYIEREADLLSQEEPK